MLSILLETLFKNNNKELWNLVVRNSFFLLNGTLIGILLNDLLRLLYADFANKELIEYSVSGLVSASGYLFKLPLLNNNQNNFSLGMGMGLGTLWANMTEYQRPVSLINGNTKNNRVSISN